MLEIMAEILAESLSIIGVVVWSYIMIRSQDKKIGALNMELSNLRGTLNRIVQETNNNTEKAGEILTQHRDMIDVNAKDIKDIKILDLGRRNEVFQEVLHERT